MRDNINNINHSNIENINNIDNSINYNINITTERSNLKERFKNNEISEYVMFCISERKDIPKEPGFKFVLCTNVYSGYEFMIDHVHVKFPEKYYDELDNFSIVKIKGKVYEYTRGDKTKDISIEVLDVLDMSNRFLKFNRGMFRLNREPDRNVVENFDKIINKYEDENLYDIIYEQLLILDGQLTNGTYINQGFITGLIMTRYFLNTNLRLLVNQKNALRTASKEALIDIFKILSYLIYGINQGEVFLWRNLLRSLNTVCNYLQGINHDFNNITIDEKEELSKNINKFKIKINQERSTKKLYGTCRTYNKNTGYSYPQDISEFEEGLKFTAMSYLLSKGYYPLR